MRPDSQSIHSGAGEAFTPFAGDDRDELPLVAAAKAGDMSAMDRLVRRHQPWVLNLALRMIWRRDLAEDAAQEILIKAVTRLSTFEQRSKFSTWLYRIAVNHLLNVRKSEMEEQGATFASVGRDMDGLPDADLPDESTLPIGHELLIEEAKLGCITAMLMCLERRQRLAFILGEIFGVTSDLGGELLEISADNFRQLLSRARRDLYQFMQGKCGLINQSNPCRCAKKARVFMDRGWVDPHRRQFTTERLGAARELAPDRLAELTAIERAHAEVYRAAPFVRPQIDALHKLRDALGASGFNRE